VYLSPFFLRPCFKEKSTRRSISLSCMAGDLGRNGIAGSSPDGWHVSPRTFFRFYLSVICDPPYSYVIIPPSFGISLWWACAIFMICMVSRSQLSGLFVTRAPSEEPLASFLYFESRLLPIPCKTNDKLRGLWLFSDLVLFLFVLESTLITLLINADATRLSLYVSPSPPFLRDHLPAEM